eukprot:5739629-Pleurochrysis_carterae.AAC.4
MPGLLPHPPVYVAARLPAGERLTIDADLNKPIWKTVPWSRPFQDIRGKRDAPSGSQARRLCSLGRTRETRAHSFAVCESPPPLHAQCNAV